MAESKLKPTNFNSSQPYCPLSCSVPLSLYLWSYISDFAILFCYSTYTCRQRQKKASVRLLVENRRHMHREAHTQVLYTHCLYHLQNICLPSNMASKAACYLDCISFLMFQLWYGTALISVNDTSSCYSAWKSASLSPSCPNNMSVFLAVWIIKWRQMIRQTPANSVSHENCLKLRLYRCA